MKKFFHRFVAITAVMILTLSFAGCSMFERPDSSSTPSVPDSIVSAQSVAFKTQPEETRKELTRTEAVKMVERSVVAIEMKKESSTSYGSGIIIDVEDSSDKEFYVLTAHHVISDGGNITVYVPDVNTRNFTDEDYQERFAFKGVIDNVIHTDKAITLVGGDAESDVAVLKLNLEGTEVSPEEIVSSSLPHADYSMSRGESVFAIGNPSGQLPMNVSAGIISYLDREIYLNQVGYMMLVQIDVQINHGSSGGGLFNLYGELIAITNSGNESYDGINYAIPHKATYASVDNGFVNIASQLIGTKTDSNYGYVSGRWSLGIVTNQKSNSYNGSTYVELKSIVEGSNVDLSNKANTDNAIQVGDIITKIIYFEGTDKKEVKISSLSDLSSAVYKMKKHLKLGDTFTIEVDRPINSYQSKKISSVVELKVQNIFCDTNATPTNG